MLLCLEGLCIHQHFRFFLTQNRHPVTVQKTYFFRYNFIRILLLSGNEIHTDQTHSENNNFPLPSLNIQHTNFHWFKHTEMCSVHPWHIYKATKTMTAELPQPWERSMNCRFQEDYSYKFQLDYKTLHNSCRGQRKRTRQGIFRMQVVPLQITQRFPLTWSLIYAINHPLYRWLNNTNKEASWK